MLLNCFLSCNIMILLYEFGSYLFLNRHIFLSFLSHSNFHIYVNFDTECSSKGKRIAAVLSVQLLVFTLATIHQVPLVLCLAFN